jgi:phosphoribosyl-ATP pyrophosphohydrolase
MSEVLKELATVLEQRKLASSENSYVVSLYKQGLRKILQKVEEETQETVEAAKKCNSTNEETKSAVIHETADLWFHTLVMLSYLDLGPGQVLEELEKRFNISGLEEKASRHN